MAGPLIPLSRFLAELAKRESLKKAATTAGPSPEDLLFDLLQNNPKVTTAKLEEVGRLFAEVEEIKRTRTPEQKKEKWQRKAKRDADALRLGQKHGDRYGLELNKWKSQIPEVVDREDLLNKRIYKLITEMVNTK